MLGHYDSNEEHHDGLDALRKAIGESRKVAEMMVPDGAGTMLPDALEFVQSDLEQDLIDRGMLLKILHELELMCPKCIFKAGVLFGVLSEKLRRQNADNQGQVGGSAEPISVSGEEWLRGIAEELEKERLSRANKKPPEQQEGQ